MSIAEHLRKLLVVNKSPEMEILCEVIQILDAKQERLSRRVERVQEKQNRFETE